MYLHKPYSPSFLDLGFVKLMEESNIKEQEQGVNVNVVEGVSVCNALMEEDVHVVNVGEGVNVCNDLGCFQLMGEDNIKEEQEQGVDVNEKDMSGNVVDDLNVNEGVSVFDEKDLNGNVVDDLEQVKLQEQGGDESKKRKRGRPRKKQMDDKNLKRGVVVSTSVSIDERKQKQGNDKNLDDQSEENAMGVEGEEIENIKDDKNVYFQVETLLQGSNMQGEDCEEKKTVRRSGRKLTYQAFKPWVIFLF